MLIAIDGPAASGKGTVARRLSAHFALPYLDTGLLYRAVALRLQDDRQPLDDAAAAERAAMALVPADLDDERLRERTVGEAASIVATIRPVRDALLAYQRGVARSPAGAVLDGRDIATVIAPDADAKLFVTASPQVRAHRRFLELCSRGERVSEHEVLADIRIRDARDSGRADAPLRIAEGARLLDTSTLSIEAAFREALGIVESFRRDGRAS